MTMAIYDGEVGTGYYAVLVAEPTGMYQYDVLVVVQADEPLPDQEQVSIHINDTSNNLPATDVAALTLGWASDLNAQFPGWVAGQTRPLPSGGQIRVGFQDTEYGGDGQIRFDVNIIGGSAEDLVSLVAFRDAAQARLRDQYFGGPT